MSQHTSESAGRAEGPTGRLRDTEQNSPQFVPEKQGLADVHQWQLATHREAQGGWSDTPPGPKRHEPSILQRPGKASQQVTDFQEESGHGAWRSNSGVPDGDALCRGVNWW